MDKTRNVLVSVYHTAQGNLGLLFLHTLGKNLGKEKRVFI